jgi:hypothetical protein
VLLPKQVSALVGIMTKRTEWFLLLCVLLLAAVLRIQAVSTTQIDHPVRADAREYYLSALNLQRWQVFSGATPDISAPAPDAARPPLMPVLLTPFVVFPPTDVMLFHFNLLQVGMDVLTVGFTFLLFRLFSGALLALSAALLAACSPHLVSMTTYLLTETSFTFFLTAGLCLTAFALKREVLWGALLGGGALGLSALTRETTEYLPIFMLCSLCWFLDKKLVFRILMPTAIVALGVVWAWKFRNLSAIGSFSDPSLAVRTIHHGMYPGLMYNDDPNSFGVPYRLDPLSPRMTDLGGVLGVLWERFIAAPAKYLFWFLIGKPLAFFQWNLQDGTGDVFVYPLIYTPYLDNPLFVWTHALFRLLHVPLMISSILGAAVVLWRPKLLGLIGNARLPALLIVCVIGYFVAIHMVGFPLARYSVPLRPCMYGLGLFTIVMLIRQAWAQYRAGKHPMA